MVLINKFVFSLCKFHLFHTKGEKVLKKKNPNVYWKLKSMKLALHKLVDIWVNCFIYSI